MKIQDKSTAFSFGLFYILLRQLGGAGVRTFQGDAVCLVLPHIPIPFGGQPRGCHFWELAVQHRHGLVCLQRINYLNGRDPFMAIGACQPIVFKIR